MIKILLVDDHALIRTGIRSILENADDIDIIGEASTGEEAVDFVRQNQPDIVMMDINMPGIGGIEATRRIIAQETGVKVIAVTALSDEPFPHRLLGAGALGYVSKGCAAEEMFEAVRTVAQGRPYISNEVARKLSLAGIGGRDKPDALLDTLSSRELQVMMMITEGHTTQDISETLHLSPKTVSTYRYRLFEKLQVTNDVELTHFAMRHGLLENGNVT